MMLTAALTASLLAGCSLLPQEDEKEALPEIRVPKISQKPEYPVKKSTLELKATGTGKLMSEREENLFFEVDNRRVTNVLVKAGDDVKKGQTLAELDTGDTESQIRRKEIEIEKAELDMTAALRDSEEAGDDIQLKKRKLDYELLKQELAELREELNGSKLVAPFDGKLVSFVAEKGDTARAYEKIGRIADMNALVVAVRFNTSDLESIAPGMKTIVGINAAGEVEGTVRRLPIEDGGSGNDEDSLDSYALVDVPKLPKGIGHGTPLSASVIVDRRADVLSIPLAALRVQNNRSYVLVSNADGSKGEVDVEVGAQTSTDAEIIKGLEEGQKVVGK